MWKSLWKTLCPGALLVVLLWEAPGCADDSRSGEESLEPEWDSLEVLTERRLKDEAFRSAPDSPIPLPQRRQFAGLCYYPPTREYVLPAVLQRFQRLDTVELASTRAGYRHRMLRYGRLLFPLGDTVLSLTVYKPLEEGGLLFIPFADATTGQETYAGGRYLELQEEPGEEEYVLDFNRAFNPYCAYNEEYACPVVPAENRLPIPIRAGERMCTSKVQR